MTQNEITQSLNLARALDLVVSSRIVNGVMYVYNAAGQSKSWDSFATEYPLERLQAMVARAQLQHKSAH
ncbi:MAG: hypothetical protein HC866_17340 [Leptolyngbyaceae cyanobacterium RU_5_1]|nr:hypothetical protein [Leptolyngbyaceae cyanobacterium RU_5_1]